MTRLHSILGIREETLISPKVLVLVLVLLVMLLMGKGMSEVYPRVRTQKAD